MAISERTRKLLWGRSGNACAICGRPLTEDPSNAADRHAVLGAECHIVARSGSGPRGGEIAPENLDEYYNLILLCPTDHKRVDDQPAAFPADRLRQIKREHEARVEKSMAGAPTQPQMRWVVPRNLTVPLTRVTTGAEILDPVRRALAYHFHEADPKTEAEAELQGDFLQDLADLGDIFDDIGPGDRVREKFRMTERLQELAEAGFEVHVGVYDRTLEVNGDRSSFPTAVVKLVRKTDSTSESSEADPASGANS